MAYSKKSDLLIGDVSVGSVLDPQKFVDDAAKEMDSRIGMVYDLPLPVDDLAAHVVTLLELINNRLASGRLLMAAAAGGSDVHRYGKSLVDDAFCDLAKILDGSIQIEGATRRDDGTHGQGPSVLNTDTYSPFDAYEAVFFPATLGPRVDTDPIWRPGV